MSNDDYKETIFYTGFYKTMSKNCLSIKMSNNDQICLIMWETLHRQFRLHLKLTKPPCKHVNVYLNIRFKLILPNRVGLHHYMFLH